MQHDHDQHGVWKMKDENSYPSPDDDGWEAFVIASLIIAFTAFLLLIFWLLT